jgi:hypothetical protein
MPRGGAETGRLRDGDRAEHGGAGDEQRDEGDV